MSLPKLNRKPVEILVEGLDGPVVAHRLTVAQLDEILSLNDDLEGAKKTISTSVREEGVDEWIEQLDADVALTLSMKIIRISTPEGLDGAAEGN